MSQDPPVKELPDDPRKPEDITSEDNEDVNEDTQQEESDKEDE